MTVDKRGASSEPPLPQPEGTEVESARLLANESREPLRRIGMDDEEIRRLADAYIAEDRGDDLGEFIEWASEVHQRATG